MAKRNYRNNLSYVEEGFVACWENAQQLTMGAKILLDGALHAQALSLSVLALEELGKLFCIDGLLFARPDDEKAQAFGKSLKSHSTKLSALTLFPFLLGQLANADPRLTKEPAFGLAIAHSVADLKEKGNRVFALLENESFQDLDQLKQTGFYSQSRSNSFIKPSDAIATKTAEAVYERAWRATSTLDFVLKRGNLERYIASAREIRSKLDEADHQALELQAESVLKDLFPDEVDQDATTVKQAIRVGPRIPNP